MIKVSGFHETAWGSRSVVIGDDVSGEGWGEKISNALNHYPSPVFIIQEFMKPRTFKHPVFLMRMEYRMNQEEFACLLIFSPLIKKQNGQVRLQLFALQTKKFIHGMKDGCIMPCKGVCLSLLPGCWPVRVGS